MVYYTNTVYTGTVPYKMTKIQKLKALDAMSTRAILIVFAFNVPMSFVTLRTAVDSARSLSEPCKAILMSTS